MPEIYALPVPHRIEYHSHPDKDGICIFTLFYPDESAEDGEFVEVQLEDPRGFGFDLPTAEQVTP